MIKGISILGSTGSIGRNTLDVIRALPDRFRVVGLGAGKNIELLKTQIKEFSPSVVSVANNKDIDKLAGLLENSERKTPDIRWGEEGLAELAALAEADIVVIGVVGTGGLVPLIKALEAGKLVALASKECLVAGGELVQRVIKNNMGLMIPVDSEISALFQCLVGEERTQVKRLNLTASGGPFRGFNRHELEVVTIKEALAHPVWKMGGRITIDSATLMNKGFEVIETHWFFGLDYDAISVVVHPEGIVHSLVSFNDGSVKAQLSAPDMRLPILYALSYPSRHECPFEGLTLDLTALINLSFYEPDRELFPCLDLALRAGRAGGTYPAVLNAADEVAVEAFLQGEIRFSGIPGIIRRCLDEYDNTPCSGLEQIRLAEAWGRRIAGRFCRESRYRI